MAFISEIKEEKVTVLIDGNSIAYRAFFKAPPLTAGGIPTGVIHVFLLVLEKLSNHPKVGNIIAVFDHRGKNRRHQLLETYKATRDAMPEDLSIQLEALKEIIPLLGIPLYCVNGYEADDVINTLAKKSTSPIWLVTKDKDLYQLVNDNLKIYDYSSGDLTDKGGVYKKFGLYPENILDMLGLAGDTADNIPGIAGIGPKTAQSLIEKYGSIEGIYDHVSEIKGKLQEKLIQGKESAFLSRQLAELIMIEDLPECKNERDNTKLRALYEKYRLKHHLNTLNIEETSNNKGQSTTFSEDTGSQTHFLEEGHVENVELIAFIDGEIFAAGDGKYEICNEKRNAQYYFDVKNLYKKGFIGKESLFDIMLASWLADPDSGGLKKSKTEGAIEFLSSIYKQMQDIHDKLKDLELEELYYKMELPVAYILADAEKKGILVDVKIIRDMAQSLRIEINAILKKLNELYDFPANLNSPKQLGSYLYDTLGLKPLKKNKRGYSTDEETLIALRGMYSDKAEILDKILKYRELNKILSTYTENLLEFMGNDGRIHTDFKQTGTATGRLSSVNPNLQNIPQRSDASKNVRCSFIAEEGKTFVSIDYSQIELRILAHLSGDETLKTSFLEDKDIHSITARSIFHLQEGEEVSSDLRRIAKAVNFGILYGLSSFGLSRDTKVSASEAKVFIERYFTLYKKVGAFIDETIAKTKIDGFCSTILGRKRIIKDINSRNGSIRQRAERMAINAPIQGSAADIIKLAMIECDKYIKESNSNARLLLQIHDELLFEVAENEATAFSMKAAEIMENVFKADVPFTVNCSIGKNWGDL